MTTTAGTSEHGDLEQLLREALKHQYRAALRLLQQAVERCPEQQWTSGDPAFWQVAYHTAFYTHLYLQPSFSAFTPWEHAREEYHVLGALPEPPHRPPKLGEPYGKARVLEYVAKCQGMAEAAIDALDLTARDAGFPWYRPVEGRTPDSQHPAHRTPHGLPVRASAGRRRYGRRLSRCCNFHVIA